MNNLNNQKKETRKKIISVKFRLWLERKQNKRIEKKTRRRKNIWEKEKISGEETDVGWNTVFGVSDK